MVHLKMPGTPVLVKLAGRAALESLPDRPTKNDCPTTCSALHSGPFLTSLCRSCRGEPTSERARVAGPVSPGVGVA